MATKEERLDAEHALCIAAIDYCNANKRGNAKEITGAKNVVLAAAIHYGEILKFAFHDKFNE